MSVAFLDLETKGMHLEHGMERMVPITAGLEGLVLDSGFVGCNPTDLWRVMLMLLRCLDASVLALRRG